MKLTGVSLAGVVNPLIRGAELATESRPEEETDLNDEPSEPSFEDALELRPQGGRTAVFTRLAIPAGAVVSRMRGERLDRPSRYTFQLGEGRHLGKSGLPYDEMLHACRPNVRVDLADPDRPVLRAIREIPAGGELTVDYCATEEEMAEPFDCACGAPGCYRMVRGYRFLTEEQRAAIGDNAAPHLRRRYAAGRELATAAG